MGLGPQALYSDRASWAALTPAKGEPVDTLRPTQVGRALRRLGIEHILAYSPQARGRSERINRALQDRFINELRIAGVHTIERANRYLTECFVPHYNAEFGRTPQDQASASAFVSIGDHTYSTWRGPKCLALYDSRGRIQTPNATASSPISRAEAAA